MSGWKNRISGWFVDREFFMRSNGQVRFLKISARLQRRVAIVVAAVLGVWLLVTLGMLVNQVSVAIERMTLSSKQLAIKEREERVAKYTGTIDEVTEDLQRRQKLLEALSDKYLDEIPAAAAPVSDVEVDKTTKEISALVPEAAGLARIEARQLALAEKLTRLADIRAARAASEIRKFGLNPDALAKEASSDVGGPFIPFFGSKSKDVTDPRFTRLAVSLERMDSLERALRGMPTSMPAAVMSMTSNFGYRHDPFTGAGAMHAGVDFRGPIGTPILAAADGVVSFAGVHNGYGNCVEITHPNGLVTRYAHLSAYQVMVGQKVKRGVQIARMGSTGRSTGPHLHFEVRQDGVAINPLKFLEAHPDVLEVQDVRAGRAVHSK